MCAFSLFCSPISWLLFVCDCSYSSSISFCVNNTGIEWKVGLKNENEQKSNSFTGKSFKCELLNPYKNTVDTEKNKLSKKLTMSLLQ